MSNKISSIELTKFKESSAALDYYRQARDAFKASGLPGLLRIFARPYTVDGGANPHRAAYSAGVSEGYNQCLDDLLYFEEQYLQQGVSAKKILADFGGQRLALSKGDLTQADLEKLNGSRK
jgi:hypothetical protein